MKSQIKVLEKVKLKKPILVEGLPGIGNVGRVSAGYLVNELKMKKFAELYSPHFLPLVILHSDAVTHLLKCEFFYFKNKNRDIVILTGDSQSISPEGHYELSETVLDFCEKIGVKDIITLGGFSEGKEVKTPRVIGAVNDKSVLKKYKGFDIDFGAQHPVGTIVGASGLLIGLAKLRNIDGLCLMGETTGLPIITDPRSADRILQVLVKILSLKLDLSKLENTIKEMEEKIEKTDKLHQKMIDQIPKQKEDQQIKYIG